MQICKVFIGQTKNPLRLRDGEGFPAVPPWLGRPRSFLETKNPIVMTIGSEPASLFRVRLRRQRAAYTLCPDNGGNSGAGYWCGHGGEVCSSRRNSTFALQLRGPFGADVWAGLSPSPALWTTGPARTRPLHSHWDRDIQLGKLYQTCGQMSNRVHPCKMLPRKFTFDLTGQKLDKGRGLLYCGERASPTTPSPNPTGCRPAGVGATHRRGDPSSTVYCFVTPPPRAASKRVTRLLCFGG